jgi:cytochrome c-type biogenesis protein CcmE
VKKSNIVVIVLIAVAIGIILSTFADSSTYASFNEAMENPERKYQVVGTLSRSKALEYNPEMNANLFKFYLVDREGVEKEVIFKGSKPQDFERSEQVVIKGRISGKSFQADEILMKCPSKYNDGSEGLKEFKAAGES